MGQYHLRNQEPLSGNVLHVVAVGNSAGTVKQPPMRRWIQAGTLVALQKAVV